MLQHHGLTVEINQSSEDTFFMYFSIVGTLTHEDYAQIMPMMDEALADVEEPKINAFIDISELVGWEARAAWDDFKLGLKYNFNFEKVAVYGEHKLLDFGMKVASWFMHGDIQKFEHKSKALAWLET